MISKPARFTAGFVAVGLAAILLVVAGGAFTAYFFASRGLAEVVDEQARAVPDTYALYAASERDPVRAAVQSVLHLTRSGVRIRFFSPERGFGVDSDGSVRQARFGAFGPFGRSRRPPHRPGSSAPGSPPPGAPGDLGGPQGFGPPPGRGPQAPGGDPGPRFGDQPRTLFLLANVLGLHPQRVVVPGGFFFVDPDVNAVAAQLRAAAVATLLVALLVIGLLIALRRTVRREALRPLLETTAALNRLAERDFTPYEVRTEKRDAIGELARAYTSASATVAAAFEERRLAQSEMQRFVADAGHELRTPLTVVTGYLDVLEGGAINDPVLTQRIFATLRAESRRMRGLIDNLIVLARLEQFDAHRGDTVDASAVASRVVHTFAPLAPSGEIAFTPARAAFVRGQESELAEALSNLVENALKHAEGAAIAVRVASDATGVAIAVSDDGPGMTSEDREHAFERFYRGEGRGETSGSGLGLAIVKRTAERAGGTIALASEEGRGTTITLHFPHATETFASSENALDESIP
jgi:two-component system OmpR family sensor kinase